ncbi:M-phase inducer phosphatase 3 [Phytophthora ramorum]|uniref:M-phase inducer phosphatase 3 n=1 Tax=Phytophthora ramorum TaxID=164328 RepID=UPI00309F4F8F|nr:M-phase inducer phosphatase 3 [Phytophthora ramorum]
MADEQDGRPRHSRLTPLLSERLQLSTPPRSPPTRQSTVQNSEKPSKKALGRSRRLQDRDVGNSRRTPRAIFNEENDDITEHSSLQPAQTEHSMTSDVLQVLETSESEKVQKSGDFEDAGPYCQDRKRPAAGQAQDGVELSPRSHLSQQKAGKKKSKLQMNRMQVTPSGRGEIVLKRAASSQTVLTSGSLSPAPVLPPRLLRYHTSEQSMNVMSAVPLKPILPTVYSGRHPDLNVITPGTVANVLRGEFKDELADFELLDCRFPFEFEGGSLKGAISLCDPDRMDAKFFLSTALENCTRTALIFFCEFSANRAPKMLRHVRNVDRRLHADSYPELYYPELYLIDGGYKHCFETLQTELCAPSAVYVPMDDENYVEECRLEFAAWRRRWKPHKTVANCAAKLEKHTSQLDCAESLDRIRPDTSNGVRSLFDQL